MLTLLQAQKQEKELPYEGTNVLVMKDWQWLRIIIGQNRILWKFLRGKHSVSWLFEKAHELEQLSLTPNKSLRAKLQNNARAVRSYAEHFAGSQFQLLPAEKFPFHLNGVTINVTPDIHVLDAAGNQRYITFSFCQKKMKHEYVRTLLHCMSYGVFTHSLPPTSAAFINVATGTVHPGVHVTPDLIVELSTHCGEVQAAWDAL